MRSFVMSTMMTLTKVKVSIEGIAPGVLFQSKGLMELERNGH
jgi:hypothetical protein